MQNIFHPFLLPYFLCYSSTYTIHTALESIIHYSMHEGRKMKEEGRRRILNSILNKFLLINEQCFFTSTLAALVVMGLHLNDALSLFCTLFLKQVGSKAFYLPSLCFYVILSMFHYDHPAYSFSE